MTEEQLRNVAADQMASAFIVEILLSRYIKSHPRETWFDLCETLVKSAQKTDHFTAIIKTEEEAEVFADVVVKMHDAIEGYTKRALARAVASYQPGTGKAET